ncbi:MAG: hypothetical protein AD742_19805 [Methylibium sp. NZG]|nr:MAG: hypothetical protein AD742_19805 [Methylibium sp. NZG]
MIDRFFFSALTFCLLAGGTLAIGSAWFESPPAAPTAARVVQVVQLPPVVITGKRIESSRTLAQTEAVEPAASTLR